MLRQVQFTSIIIVVFGFAFSSLAYDTKRTLDSASVTPVTSEKELEIQALATIAKNEREARKWHRAIERYRDVMARVEAKQAAGVPSERISIPYTEIAGMMKVLRTQSGPSRRFVRELMRRNIDLEAYLESGVMPEEFTHYMEEVVVVGNVFDHIPMDPVHFSVDDVKNVRVQRHNAHELYQEGYYDEAYPILLNLAKRGFKDSQSRLAYILFNGTGTVEKSNLRALGWLGAAAHGQTDPMFRKLFRRYMSQIPDDVRNTVDLVVDGYRSAYARSDHMDCTTNHVAHSGIVRRAICRIDF